MSWTERLNDAVPSVRLGTAVVDVHEWAHWNEPVHRPPHRHSYFVVCRVEGGEGEFTVGDRSRRVRRGDLLYARPWVRHRILGPEGFRLSCVAFEVTSGPHEGRPLDETGAVLQGFLGADITVVRDTGAVGAVWEILKEAARGPRTPGQQALLAALAQALLVGLARAGGGEAWAGALEARAPDRHTRTVRLAVRYIHDNLDRPLRVEELASQVSVSPRQLTRLFASVLGEPPASYVERVRLERAAGLLTSTRMPIKQIAADLGYPDVPTFTRAFARQHRTPPGRYRRTSAAGADPG